MPDASAPISLIYRFRFEDGTERDFEIRLHPETLELLLEGEIQRPEWTKLEFHQCQNCPLGSEVEYCPVAVSLANLVPHFGDVASFTKATVTVLSKERTYTKDTTVQKGLSAMIGIYMVTSNCPVMDKLRPMVRFHLPFATLSETAYRAITMYLLAQFLLMQKGLQPDWELKKLPDIYRAVSIVNKGISQRVSAASSTDAGANAVVILNSLGDSVPYVIDNGLGELEPVFKTYLDEKKQSPSP